MRCRTRSPQNSCRFVEVRVRRVRPQGERYAVGGSRAYQRSAAHHHGPDCSRGVVDRIQIDGREFKREARLIDDPDGTGCGGPDCAVVRARDFHWSTRSHEAGQSNSAPMSCPWRIADYVAISTASCHRECKAESPVSKGRKGARGGRGMAQDVDFFDSGAILFDTEYTKMGRHPIISP